MGYSLYSRGNLSDIVVDDSDLSITYTEQEETDVSETNATRVGQTGILEYMIHQYKDFVNEKDYCTIEWLGRSTLEPTRSTIYLQIYNQTSGLWETIDSNDTASYDQDVELEKTLLDLTNYKTEGNIMSCRIYQEAILWVIY